MIRRDRALLVGLGLLVLVALVTAFAVGYQQYRLSERCLVFGTVLRATKGQVQRQQMEEHWPLLGPESRGRLWEHASAPGWLLAQVQADFSGPLDPVAIVWGHRFW